MTTRQEAFMVTDLAELAKPY